MRPFVDVYGGGGVRCWSAVVDSPSADRQGRGWDWWGREAGVVTAVVLLLLSGFSQAPWCSCVEGDAFPPM